MADTESLKNAYETGREAHRKGDLQTARECYESVVASDPEHAEALHGLGNIETQQGQLESAEKHLRKAIELNRYGVGFQNSLGNLLIALHRYRDAETAYFEELRMRPDFSVSHNQLGNLMMRSGNHERAIKHFQSALQFAPEFAVAANNLGNAYLQSDQLTEAAEAFNHAIKLNAQLDEAYANMGLLSYRKGNSEEAATHLAKALEINPECGVAMRGIGILRLSQSRVQEALAAFAKAAEVNPDDVESVHALARIWHKQGMLDLAERYFVRARELSPNNVEILNQLAALLWQRGDIEAATSNYERALQIKPSDQVSLAGFGRLKAQSGDTKLALSKLSSVVQSGRAGTELLGAYSKLLGAADRGREGIALLEQRLRTTVPKDEKCSMHFTLGELLDSDGSYDLAFYHFRKANELRKAVFDGKNFDQYCTRIIESFKPDVFAEANRSGNNEDRLVFVIGMARSGVRVLERLIGQIDDSYVTDHSPFIEMSAYRISAEHKTQWPQGIEHFSVQSLEQYAQTYLQKISTETRDASLVVDATWRNFLYVGLIELLFPNARIVYCSRDYRDIALSCYFTDMSAQTGIAFTYNMRDIATFINGHKRLMSHWHKTSTLPMHVVSYENLILDYDGEIKSLQSFLNQEYAENDENGNANDKLPKPSLLKSTSLRRYRHYRKHLEGFVDDLESPPDQPF